MHRATPLLLTLLTACGPASSPLADTSTSAAGPTGTTEPTPGPTEPAEPTTGTTVASTLDLQATSTGDASTTTTTTTTAADSFIVAPDAGCESSGCIECDPFTQDCAAGQKCMPWAQGGVSHWNATKCVPVTGDGQLGDPCTAVDSGTSGLDDCAPGHMCWYLDDSLQGTCVPLCSGSLRQPECPENTNTSCSLSSDGVISLCLAQCDPVLANCPAGQLCAPNVDTFGCVPDASGDAGQFGDPCEAISECDPGLLCADATTTSRSCDPDANGCCSPFCERPDGPCPGQGQQCLPWYDPPGPPGSEHIGICALPR